MLEAHQRHIARQSTFAIKMFLAVFCLTGSYAVVANSTADVFSAAEFELANSENADYFSPKETLRIIIPAAFDQQKISNLSLELDAVDISEMVQLENGKIIYKPLQAMLAVPHELRLTEYTNDGDINELGVWHFNVRMSGLVEEYSFAADTQLNSNYRVSEKNSGYSLPDRLQSDANSQVGFKIKNGNWHAEGQFDLIYTSLKGNRPSDRTIENNEFLFRMGNQFLDAKIGHQNITQSSLIMDNFRRRGISIEGKIPSFNSTLTGFSLSSIDISGFGHGLGIGDSQQRVTGYGFTSSPITDSPKMLNISTTWISGRGTEDNNYVSIYDDFQDPNTLRPESERSNAWSFITDSLLLDDKLRVRAEYAATEYDFNPLDSLQEDKDNAKNLLVTYADYTENGIAWNAGLNYQRIGTYFKSLANRGLPSDKELSKLFAGMQWETIGIEFSGEQQKDNLAKREQLPETTTQLSSININWTPQLTSNQSWLGTPSFSFGYNLQDQLQDNLPLDYFYPAANNQMKNWQASGSFNYETNSWGMTLMNTIFTDKSGVQNDSSTDSYNLFANFTFDEIGSLSPSIQFDQTKDNVTGFISTGVTYSIQSMLSLIQGELDASANLAYNKNETNDALTRGENLAFNLSLNWLVREAAANQLGVALAFGAMYNNFEDRIYNPNSLEAYQIYLTATLTLPSRVGN